MWKFLAVDALEGVPAEFRSVYSTTPNAEGKYEVSEAHKAFVNAYTGQATALDQERGKVKSLNSENATRRAATKPFEDLVAELGVTVENDDIAGAIKTHVATLTDKVKGGEAFKGNLAKIKQESEARIEQIKLDAKKETDAMMVTLTDHLIGKEAIAALVSAKAKNGGSLLLPHLTSKLKVLKDESGKYVVRAVDAAGEVRFNSAAQPMGVPDVVKELRENADYGFAFESESAAGSGSPPGGSKTPAAVKLSGQQQQQTESSVSKISKGLDQLVGKR